MHPAKEKACDDLLEHPMLLTPPSEPEKPRPPRERKPRVFKMPPRFPLLSVDFYNSWCNHRKVLILSTCKVDDQPPPLFPELYLKPQRLDYYAGQLEAIMNVNKELLKKINHIQRTGGWVDCWNENRTKAINIKKCGQRQRILDEIREKNVFFYSRLLAARSEQPLTSELEESWLDTKTKLMLGSSLPFILFKTETIDRGMHDPLFDKPPNISRTRVILEICVAGGSKLGKVTIELFTDIVPETCKLFMTLIRGDNNGYAYTNSKIFRIVPGLYFRAGDVVKNNGFGCYLPAGQVEPSGAENYNLFHSIPGVLSMVVSKDNEVCGQFNITFKPLPQFDKKHVVFGRIVCGPVTVMERISAIGRPFGTTYVDVILRTCGYINRRGDLIVGGPNTHKEFKFDPPKRMRSV